jgi:Putative endonuclease segE, GIY-YIG domain
MSDWFYQDKKFELDESDSSLFGFVYAITSICSGKRYIGKKRFYKALSRKPLKNHKRRRRFRIVSDWEDYYGSNKSLQAEVSEKGKHRFRREILRLCSSPGEMSYYEAKFQFDLGVLLSPNNYYNDWIQCKIHRTHLKKVVDSLDASQYTPDIRETH